MTMNPAIQACSKRSAFTLIEVMIGLFIASLIIGLTVFSLDSLSDEKRLRRPANKMKELARDAMRRSVSTQRSYSIFMNQTFFMLRETHVRQEDVDDFYRNQNERLSEGPSLFDDEEEISRPQQRIIARYELPEGMTIQWKRWIDKDLSVPKSVEWVFDPSGICEPVTIAFSNDRGFIEMDFNPLTAKVQDERMIIDP